MMNLSYSFPLKIIFAVSSKLGVEVVELDELVDEGPGLRSTPAISSKAIIINI